MQETDSLLLSQMTQTRCQRRQALFKASLICLTAMVVLTVALSFSKKKVILEDANKDCPEELLESGGCHIDGNEVQKDEDVSEKWATTEWMNGYDDVTGQDVVSDEYVPWVDKLNAELGDSKTVVLPAIPPVAPQLPSTVQIVSGTTVIVPTCDPVFGCKSNLACVDRWDWIGPYGACDAYADWTRRMGWCEDDIDVYGVPASVACPVSCDTCPLGMCYDPYSKALSACAGGASG